MQAYLQLALLVILYTAFLDALKFRCDYRYTPQGWFKYQEIPAVWADARLKCKLEGGTLASPTTTEIKSIMMDSFCKPEIFTGFHSTFSKGHYVSGDGVLDDITHEWAAFEPDNKNDSERCIVLRSDGKIADVRCDEPRPYVCFRPPSTLDVSICGTPDPDYHFDNRTNKCYKFHTNPRQFMRANFACSAEGGHLAIINSEDESKIIRDVFAQYPAWKLLPGIYQKDVAFIGFHNWDESYDWTTLQGQSLQDAGFAKWPQGQPDSGVTHEYCGSVFRTGLLNDLLCDHHAVFICEKNPNYPPVCDIETAQNITRYKRYCDNDVEEQKEQVDSGAGNLVAVV